MNFKQVIVVREDLGMSPGKMAAQAAHAAIGAFVECQMNFPGIAKTWLEEGYKKVVVRVPDLEKAEKVYIKSRNLGLPTHMVVDYGLTEVAPNTVTCIGIGPARDDDVDKVTGRLKLW